MPTFHEDDPGDIDPDASARCPRRLGGGDRGPACRALVLVRDAREHGAWHDALDRALAAPVELQALGEAEWPAELPAAESAPQL